MQTAGKSNTLLFAAAAIAIVLVAVFLAYFFVKPELESKSKLEEQRDELARRVERERQEVDEINERAQRFETDPEFVEHEARKNHRIIPGETEFIFDAPE